MKRIAIVADSTCDMPQAMVDRYNIRIIPVRILYKDAEYRDRFEITPKEVYDRLEEEVPTSSMPTPEDVISMLDELKDEGYEQVLILSLSDHLSGTHNMLRLLADDYEGMEVKVYNSKIITMGLGFMAMEAAMVAKATGSLKQVVSRMKEIRSTMTAHFTLKTMKYLKLGGRISKVVAAFGSLLNIKPVIRISTEGLYKSLAKARGRARSIETLIKEVKAQYQNKSINLAIVHGDAYQDAVKIYERIAKFANVKLKIIEQVSPAIGVHTGVGLIGVIAYEA